MTPVETSYERRRRLQAERAERERALLESNPTYIAAKRIYGRLPKEDPVTTHNRRAALMRDLQTPAKGER